MAISPIGAGTAGINPLELGGAGKAGGVEGKGSGFGEVITKALNSVEGSQNQADQLATKAATGDLTDIHDYMIAATEASLATQLTVAVRNKAVEAFNQIMNMGV